MKCPFCGRVELQRVVRDIPLTFKGRHAVVAEVSGDMCEACGEMILADGEADRIGSAMRELKLGFEPRLA